MGGVGLSQPRGGAGPPSGEGDRVAEEAPGTSGKSGRAVWGTKGLFPPLARHPAGRSPSHQALPGTLRWPLCSLTAQVHHLPCLLVNTWQRPRPDDPAGELHLWACWVLAHQSFLAGLG